MSDQDSKKKGLFPKEVWIGLAVFQAACCAFFLAQDMYGYALWAGAWIPINMYMASKT